MIYNQQDKKRPDIYYLVVLNKNLNLKFHKINNIIKINSTI